MDDYLLDASVLSHLLDSTRDRHEEVRNWLQSRDPHSRDVVSVIALAELRFGLQLAKAANRVSNLESLEAIISRAETYESLPVSRATAYEYGLLKAAVVANRMPKRLQKLEKAAWGNPERWMDEFTGDNLHIQENDLWQCAQAVEREMVFVTVDKGVRHIADAACGRLRIVLF